MSHERSASDNSFPVGGNDRAHHVASLTLAPQCVTHSPSWASVSEPHTCDLYNKIMF